MSSTLSQDDAIKIVESYKESLKMANIKYSEIYLFGSFSRNSQHAGSDIDVAVISENFGKFKPDERYDLLVARKDNELDIEPHPIGPEDLREEDWNPFIKEVKKGIKIA